MGEAQDGPSLQSPDLRMNNRDKCYVAKRDLGPERHDLPQVTRLLAVTLGLEPSLPPAGERCLHVLSPSSGPGLVMGAGGDMGMGGTPTLTSGAHSPGESTHARICITYTQQSFQSVP